jgi:TctA family transporter
VPYHWLFPSIIMFCAIGNFSINNSAMDVYLCALFGILGYVLVKLQCEPAPLILGYVLGPLMEENLRRALLISRGDPTVFFTRPIAGTFMVLSILLIIIMILPAIRKKKEQAYEEGG